MRHLLPGLLDEQRSLSAVELFAHWHRTLEEPEEIQGPAHPPARYQRLLPASPPGPGQQYAFEVSLDSCSGCKACVTACHSLNGLEPQESWRSVGLLLPSLPSSPATTDLRAPIHITTACHHCVDPACLHGCPVLAYEKDPRTGIVQHLDDQCIGCSYCTLMCPYEVPRFSQRLGIVRKCDLCQGRLAAGEPPACAQACPNDAIRITVTNTSAPPPAFPPDCPDPAITRPTTRFVSHSILSTSLRSADIGLTLPAPGHAPLVVMLVLSQFAVGAFLAETILRLAGLPVSPAMPVLGAALAALGLSASALHLGQPSKAWRSFLGWRRSWLSREILVLGTFLPVALLHAALAVFSPLDLPVSPALSSLAVTGIGTLGVLASAMVYIATRRQFWAPRRTLPRFLGTVFLSALALGSIAYPHTPGPASAPALALTLTLAVVLACKVAGEIAVVRKTPRTSQPPELARSARLLAGPLAPWVRLRHTLALTTIALSTLAAFGSGPHTTATPTAIAIAIAIAIAAALALLAGELLERSLFFRAVAPDRMPGIP